MVVKAIISAVGKNVSKAPVPNPKAFPEGTQKFTREETNTLLNDAQSKIEKIEAGEIKALDAEKLVPPDVDPLVVKGDVVAPNLTPTTVKNTSVAAPKPSSKQAVDEYLTEEQRILKETSLTGQEDDFLNFNTINGSEDVIASIKALGKQLQKNISKTTRGVVSQKETQDFATLLNLSPETLTGNILKLTPGSVLNAHQIKAAKDLVINQHKKLATLADEMATEVGDNSLKALEFAQQHALTLALTKKFKGVQTEIARALNILKVPVQPGVIKNIELDRLNRDNILMTLGGKEQIQKLAELYKATPGLINKINFLEKSEKGFLSKSSDALVEAFLNNILIAPLTHVKNIGGNWIYMTIERNERKYAAYRYGGKTIDGVAEFEDVALAFGEHMAASGMFKAFSQKFKSLKITEPLQSYKNLPGIETKVAGTKFENPVHAFTSEAFGFKGDNVFTKGFDVLGRVLTLDRLSYRFLQNADNYFKNKNYTAELYALAFRDTLKQIKLGTLTKNKAPDYLAALVTNPTKTMTETAYEAALRKAFQTPLSKRNDIVGDVTQKIQDFKNLKSLNPITILTSQFFTFLRTPANILGASLERSPFLGTNRILRSYREELAAGGATAELAKAKAATGWMFLAAFAPLGYFGVFSGSDPEIDRRKGYQLKSASNRQPKSFRFENILSEDIQELTGLTGSKLQLSLNGFEPAVLLAGVAADIGGLIANLQKDYSGWKNVDRQFYDFLAGYAVSIGTNLFNSSVLTSTGRLMDLIQSAKLSSSPGEVVIQEGKKIITNVVGFGTLLNQFEDLGSNKIQTSNYGLVNEDDFRKLNFEFKSMLQKNIPGFENDLYLDLDWLGEPIPKFSVMSSMTEHPVNKEAIKIGYNPVRIRRKMPVTAFEVSYGGVPHGIEVNVPLKEKEYAILEKVTGSYLRADLEELINSDDYKNEKDKTAKLDMFKDTAEKAKKAATAEFKNSNLFEAINARAEKLATNKWTEKNKVKKN